MDVRFDRLAGGRRIFGWRSRRRIGGDGARHQPCTAQSSLESRFRQPRLHRRGLHALPQRCGARPMITKPFRRVREKWCGVLAGKTDAGHQRDGQRHRIRPRGLISSAATSAHLARRRGPRIRHRRHNKGIISTEIAPFGGINALAKLPQIPAETTIQAAAAPISRV
jgi:hypothetical protein